MKEKLGYGIFTAVFLFTILISAIRKDTMEYHGVDSPDQQAIAQILDLLPRGQGQVNIVILNDTGEPSFSFRYADHTGGDPSIICTAEPGGFEEPPFDTMGLPEETILRACLMYLERYLSEWRENPEDERSLSFSVITPQEELLLRQNPGVPGESDWLNLKIPMTSPNGDYNATARYFGHVRHYADGALVLPPHIPFTVESPAGIHELNFFQTKGGLFVSGPEGRQLLTVPFPPEVMAEFEIRIIEAVRNGTLTEIYNLLPNPENPEAESRAIFPRSGGPES